MPGEALSSGALTDLGLCAASPCPGPYSGKAKLPGVFLL